MALLLPVHKFSLQKGYLLIEVIISVTVLVLVAMALMITTTLALKNTTTARLLTEANMYGKKYFEEWRGEILKDWTYTPPNIFAPFEVTGVVSNTCLICNPDSLKKLTVTVTWDGGTKQKQIIGFIGKN